MGLKKRDTAARYRAAVSENQTNLNNFFNLGYCRMPLQLHSP